MAMGHVQKKVIVYVLVVILETNVKYIVQERMVKCAMDTVFVNPMKFNS
jgi:hypothetical protein